MSSLSDVYFAEPASTGTLKTFLSLVTSNIFLETGYTGHGIPKQQSRA